MWKRLTETSPATLAAWAVPVAVVLFFAVNLVVSLTLSTARVDLTQDRIFTVSDATRQVLQAVDEPVTLRLFRSSALIDEAPEIRVFSDRVTELLRTYEQLSQGRVRIEAVDPVPFSAAEDRAIGYDLAGFNLSRAGERGYFGIVGTNTVDQLELIEVLTPARERYLEYDLTRMVMRLSSPTEPRIGVFDGLGLFGSMELGRRPSAIIEWLGDDYALVTLNNDVTTLPENLDAVLVIHPHSLSPSALYAIDQYVMAGGPVMVFVDPLAEHSPPDQANPTRALYPDSTFEPLLAAWGVGYARDEIVGDLSMSLQIRAQAGNQIIQANYPPWLRIDDDNLSRDDAVTSRLNIMRISSPGDLTALDGATTRFSPLVQTTPGTMIYDQATLMRRDDPRLLASQFAPSGIVRTLAARITGPAASAYPDGAPETAEPQNPPEGEAPPEPPPHLERADNINVIVVADTDMLANTHNLTPNGQPSTQNGDFVINAIDTMTGGGTLNDLRARGLSFRPFTRVDQIEAEAQARFLATEQQLQTELRETEQRLAELRSGDPSTASERPVGLSAEQQREIAGFNARIVEIREELRGVQASLRRDVDALTNTLRLANILIVPALIVLVGLGVALWRRARLSRYLRGRAATGRT